MSVCKYISSLWSKMCKNRQVFSDKEEAQHNFLRVCSLMQLSAVQSLLSEFGCAKIKVTRELEKMVKERKEDVTRITSEYQQFNSLRKAYFEKHQMMEKHLGMWASLSQHSQESKKDMYFCIEDWLKHAFAAARQGREIMHGITSSLFAESGKLNVSETLSMCLKFQTFLQDMETVKVKTHNK